MARRNFSRGGARRSRSSPLRARRWTAQLNNEALVVGTQSNVEIVSTTDYQQESTLEATGVTLARIRGNFSFTVATVAAAGTLFWSIGCYDDDEPINDVNLANSAIDEDYLYWGMVVLSVGSGAAANTNIYHIPFDVKAMRKLKEDRIVASAIVTGAGNVAVFGFCARALLIGG